MELQQTHLELHETILKLNEECIKLRAFVNQLNELSEKIVNDVSLGKSIDDILDYHDVSANKLNNYLDIVGILNCHIEMNLLEDVKFNIPETPSLDIYPEPIFEMQYIDGVSPWNFWLKHKAVDNIGILRGEIMDKIEKGALKSLSKEPKIGEYVICNDGNKVFRGMAITEKCHKTGRVKVRDVDSSFLKFLTLDKLYKIDKESCQLYAQAMNCSLTENSDDADIWTSDLGQIVSSVLRDNELVVTICNKVTVFPPRHIVQIDACSEDNQVDVNDWVLNRLIPELKAAHRNGCSTENVELSMIAQDPFFVSDNKAEPSRESQFTGDRTQPGKPNCIGDGDGPQVHSQYGTPLLVRTVTERIGTVTECVRTTTDESYSDQQTIVWDGVERMIYSKESKAVQRHDESMPSDNVECVPVSDSVVNVETRHDFSGNESHLQHAKQLEQKTYCHVQLKTPTTLLQPGKKIHAMVSHVQSPDEIFVHLAEEITTNINRILVELTEHYRKHYLKVTNHEEAQKRFGKYCAGRWRADNKWYRVEVLDWNLNGKVLVSFVDYGNKDILPLDWIQPLLEEFAVFPILAQQCHLAQIGPKNNADYWSEESIEFLKTLVNTDDGYTIIPVPAGVDDSSNSISVLFLNEGETINFIMVRDGYADFKTRKSDKRSPLVDVNENGHLEMNHVLKDMDEWNPMENDYFSPRNNFATDIDDACVAVSGYDFCEESRICKFFSKNGYCWKPVCRRDHILPDPDGFPVGKKEVFTDQFNKLKLPLVGEEILIMVTEVISVELFYVQLQEALAVSEDDEDGETFSSLLEHMNKTENVNSMRHLQLAPDIGQLIVVKTQDGIWYRARISRIDSDEGIEVVYVDFGISDFVKDTQDIRQIEAKYLHLPFQAIECHLANVLPLNEKAEPNEKCNIFFKSLILNCSLKAKVVESNHVIHYLELLIQDKDGYDVGTMMIGAGFCRPRDVINHFNTNYNDLLNG